MTGRRLFWAAVYGGALLAGPASCVVVAVAPHGAWQSIPLALGVGAAYGAGLGGLALLVRHALRRHRDHTASWS